MSLTEIHGLDDSAKKKHAAKVAGVRGCAAKDTAKIYTAAGGDPAMHSTQKDRLTHLFNRLQASDVA